MSIKYQEIDPRLIERLAPSFNLLIVTATKVEEEVLHEHLRPLPGLDHLLTLTKSKHTYYLGQFGAYPAVHMSCREMGMTGAGSSIVTTIDGIHAWSPRVVLMPGIAFGADKKEQHIGDVLVAERVKNYGPRKVGKKAVTPRGKEGPASTLLVDRFTGVKGWSHQVEDRQAKMHPGMILSGEILIDNKPLKLQLLQENPTAVGGEMEGGGIYAACDQRNVEWILVKGICDWADGNKKQNKELYQDQAVRSALSLCELVFSAAYAFQDAGLSVPAEPIPLEQYQRELSEESTGRPVWMHQHIKELKKDISHEDQQG